MNEITNNFWLKKRKERKTKENTKEMKALGWFLKKGFSNSFKMKAIKAANSGGNKLWLPKKDIKTQP